MTLSTHLYSEKGLPTLQTFRTKALPSGPTEVFLTKQPEKPAWIIEGLDVIGEGSWFFDQKESLQMSILYTSIGHATS